MQDTVNLGWKLAAEINGWAPDGLLDTYESERRPLGERVMMHTRAQTALLSPGPEVTALRELFGELIAIPEVSAHIAELLAGTDVRYDVGDDHPSAGRPVPDLTFDDGRRVAALLHSGRAVLLDLTDGAAAAVAHGWADRVDAVNASMPEPPVAAMLIRPDGYIAWATDDFVSQQRKHLEVVLDTLVRRATRLTNLIDATALPVQALGLRRSGWGTVRSSRRGIASKSDGLQLYSGRS